MKYNKPFFRLSLLPVSFFVVITFIIICYYCFSKKQPFNINVSMTTSNDSQKIVFDIIFEAFSNTDFDGIIGISIPPLQPNTETMSDEDIADRRQYREGYIAAIKQGIFRIQVDCFLKRLLNDPSYMNNVNESDGILVRLRKGSPFYNAGSLHGLEKLKPLKDKIWEEVSRVAGKYYENDKNTFIKFGASVPTSELKKRLDETPHLLAIIFLQEKLKNTPTVFVQKFCDEPKEAM